MNALIKNQMSLFKTELPEQFEIIVDQTKGTTLHITPNLSFKNEHSNKNGIELALIDWLNYEFSSNHCAQNKLQEIKKIGATNTGHIAIMHHREMTIINVDLFHTMCVISSMGYDIHVNTDAKTKQIISFTLNEIRTLKPEFS